MHQSLQTSVPQMATAFINGLISSTSKHLKCQRRTGSQPFDVFVLLVVVILYLHYVCTQVTETRYEIIRTDELQL